MCAEVLLKWIGPVNPMNLWRLESPIDAVRKLTASYVLEPIEGEFGEC